jgi:hypothetical protein
MTWIAIIGLVGWAVAGLATGMWRGERRARIYIENFRTYGQSEPAAKATAWVEPDAEDRVEEEIDRMESLMGTRVTRSGPEDNGKLEFDEDTIENGIDYLLEVAKESGEQLSRAQAKDEVERMLSAEGPEMP